VIEENEELPRLPRGWLWTNVGQIYGIVGGGTPSTKVKEYWDGDIPWITSADIYGLKDIQPQRFVTKEGIADSATNLVPERSIVVVTRVGLGKVALAEKPLCFSQDSQALIGNSSLVHPEYALHYLSVAVQIFKYKHRGTTIGGVTKKQLHELPFPLAPFNEQVRIAAKLEELFTRLDAGVEGLRKIRVQLKRYRQAVLKYAFEGKLTEEWRKTHKHQIQPFVVVRERGSNRTEKNNKQSSANLADLPELPENWTWVQIGLCSDAVSGYAFKSRDFCKDGDMPVVKIGNIGYSEFVDQGGEYLPFTFINQFREYVVESDTILMALTRPITKNTLKVCVYPKDAKTGLLNQRVAMIKPHEMIMKGFLFVYLQSSFFKKQVLEGMSETLQPNLSPIMLKTFFVPLPPLPEQKEITKEIEYRFSTSGNVELVLQHSIEQEERLRQSVLEAAFEGKLVSQDPSDEPAEKLLERIKAERTKSKGEKDTARRKKSKPRQLELSPYVE